jgi:hypothetical protein
MKTRALVTLAVASATVLAAPPAAAQETGTFTLTQNGNEIATENFTRTADRLETELLVTGRARIATEADLADDAMVDRIEIRVFPPGNPDADPIQTTAAEFGADSVHVEQPIGTPSAGQPAVRGTVPFLNPSPAHMEQIIRRARALNGDNVTVQIWMPTQGAGQVVPAQVTFNDDGSVTLGLGSTPVELQVDDEGRLTHGEIPSQGVVIERQ